MYQADLSLNNRNKEMEKEEIIIWVCDVDHIPEYKTTWSAWLDLRASGDYIIWPWMVKVISTGAKICMPVWYTFIIKGRSSWAVKRWYIVIDWTIDSDYRWEMWVVVMNIWNEDLVIRDWERIAQWILVKLSDLPISYSTEYDNFKDVYPSDRWEWWFWSTWVK